MWRAPELQFPFNSNTNMSQLYIGTPKGDIYSFGIIVQEILFRQGVFHLSYDDKKTAFKIETNEFTDKNLSKIGYKDIFGLVKTGLRPSLDASVCSKDIIDLLLRCWSESDTARPDIALINVQMRKTTKFVC